MDAKPPRGRARVRSARDTRRGEVALAEPARGKGAAAESKPAQPTPFSFLRYASVAAALIVGGALCYGGTAQFVAGLLQARADGSLQAIDWDQDNVSAALIARATDQLADADHWWPASINTYNRGAAETQLAMQSETAAAARPLLDAAMRDLKLSIEQNPTNAASWAWLSYVLFTEQGGSPATINALSMSIELARFDPTLLALRCEIGLFIYPALDDQHRATLNDQIRLLGRHSIRELVDVARLTHSLNIVIAALLAGDNQTIIRFMDLLQS